MKPVTLWAPLTLPQLMGTKMRKQQQIKQKNVGTLKNGKCCTWNAYLFCCLLAFINVRSQCSVWTACV